MVKKEKPHGIGRKVSSIRINIQPLQVRINISIGIAVTYLLVFPPIYRLYGPIAFILAMVPVTVFALALGLRGGLAAGLISFPLHLSFLFFITKDNIYLWLINGGGIGSIGLVFIGLVVGHLWDLRNQLEQELQERSKLEKQLRFNAFHDLLTSLPNHALFANRLEHMLARSKRDPELVFAVLLLGLDNFNSLNQSFGHIVGDQLLIKIARILQERLRSVDTISRFRGDEFAILLDNIRDKGDALHVAQRVKQIFNLPININGYELYVPVSTGIVLSSTNMESPDAILRDAEIALHRAKIQGKAQSVIFDTEMHTDAMERFELVTDLRHAIQSQELKVFYQPIISFKNSRITGFEALVRWQHPDRGLLSPGEFLPLAEDTELIISIDQLVLREACRQLRIWHDEYSANPPLSIHVNISNAYFTHPDLIEQVRLILRETNLSGEFLRLEMNENTIIENVELAVSRLSQLEVLGVRLDIDDFGTGNSALSFLHRIPIKTIKVDRFFVNEMNVEANGNNEIIRSIIMLAHNLGMDVIAEGVETQDQISKLLELGCEVGQGYFFSRPIDGVAAEALIASPESLSNKN